MRRYEDEYDDGTVGICYECGREINERAEYIYEPGDKASSAGPGAPAVVYHAVCPCRVCGGALTAGPDRCDCKPWDFTETPES